MTATERLRELLDERGVEWAEYGGGYTEFWVRTVVDGERYYIDVKHYTVQPNVMNNLIVTNLTPEQAIDATLGPGTCWLHDCDGSFSSVNRPVWRCDCGAFMTQYTDATTYHKPRFCPNCGKRVVC